MKDARGGSVRYSSLPCGIDSASEASIPRAGPTFYTSTLVVTRWAENGALSVRRFGRARGVRYAPRRRGQAWPKATAEGGLGLTVTPRHKPCDRLAGRAFGGLQA